MDGLRSWGSLRTREFNKQLIWDRFHAFAADPDDGDAITGYISSVMPLVAIRIYIGYPELCDAARDDISSMVAVRLIQRFRKEPDRFLSCESPKQLCGMLAGLIKWTIKGYLFDREQDFIDPRLLARRIVPSPADEADHRMTMADIAQTAARRSSGAFSESAAVIVLRCLADGSAEPLELLRNFLRVKDPAECVRIVRETAAEFLRPELV